MVGVAYRDIDRKGFYNIGEGIGGIRVSTSQGNYAYKSASGGYAIPLTSASSGSITVWSEGTGRAPDAAGKQWYLEQLGTCKTTVQTITLDLLGGATGIDAQTVANRRDVANHATERSPRAAVTGTS